MKIQNYEVGMAAEHASQQKTLVSQSTRTQTLSSVTQQQRDDNKALDVMLKLSDAGRQRQAAEQSRVPLTGIADKLSGELDPRIAVLKRVVEMLTGKEIKLGGMADYAQLRQAAQASAGDSAQQQMVVRETVSTYHYSESESLSFAAYGNITTADGKSFGFSLEFAVSRSFEYSSQTSSYSVGVSQVMDPLVLNFSGSSAELRENAKVNFDLDANGTLEEFSFVGPGSGFLALDAHNDRSIRDGSQLFGTRSGNGFADLALHDGDGNNWIDENDDVYAKLLIWSMDENGNEIVQSLKEANVGAIYLGNVSSQYSLKDSGNATMGEIRNTGVFLSEDGKAHTVQHVDLAV